MGKKSSSPPPPPDPAKTAAAQAAANRETAIANAQIAMVDQSTPWGRVTYRQLPSASGGIGEQAPSSAPAAAPAPSYDQAEAQRLWGNYQNQDPGEQASADAFNSYRQYLQGYGVAPSLSHRDPGYVAENFSGGGGTSALPGGQGGDDLAETPRYERIETLSPEGQRMLDLQNQAGVTFGEAANAQLGAVKDIMSAPMDMTALGEMPTIDSDFRASVLDSLSQRVNPMVDRERDALLTRLANSGVQEGSDAWSAAMDDWNRGQNDMRLALDAAAGDEMARRYALEMEARNQATREMLMGRTQPMNELAAMMSGSQVTQPQFASTPMPQMQAPDIMGATFGAANQANAAWQQQMQNAAANTQGLYGLLGQGAMAYAMMNPATAAAAPSLAGTGFAFSDRRLKRYIRRIGALASGLPVYLYQYIWGDGWQIGVMADEARALFPDAVVTVDGFDAVNYAEIA